MRFATAVPEVKRPLKVKKIQVAFILIFCAAQSIALTMAGMSGYLLNQPDGLTEAKHLALLTVFKILMGLCVPCLVVSFLAFLGFLYVSRPAALPALPADGAMLDP